MSEKFQQYSGPKRFWDSVGELQIAFLRREGLRPEHKLLDVGCGTFRGGRHIIEHLEPGNYYGFDKKGSAIGWGKEHVLKELVEEKEPRLFVLRMDDRPVDLAQMLEFAEFDLVWMHAFLDHIGPRKALSALRDVGSVLANDGCIFATSFIACKGKQVEERGYKIKTYSYREPWHYTMKFLENVARRAGLCMDGCPGYAHPLGLTMLKLVKA